MGKCASKHVTDIESVYPEIPEQPSATNIITTLPLPAAAAAQVEEHQEKPGGEDSPVVAACPAYVRELALPEVAACAACNPTPRYIPKRIVGPRVPRKPTSPRSYRRRLLRELRARVTPRTITNRRTVVTFAPGTKKLDGHIIHGFWVRAGKHQPCLRRVEEEEEEDDSSSEEEFMCSAPVEVCILDFC